MNDEPDRRRSAQDALRTKLDEGRARARLNQTQLAWNAGLSRTTVSKALSSSGGVPSVDTVTRLANALKLPVDELLDVRRAAVEESGTASGEVSGPGRLIGQWDPHDLEVHPAGPKQKGSGASGMRVLPGYVRREHDQVLDDAVKTGAAGYSKIVVLVGSSSTGKTRACWQAVQPLADQGWRLWHPFDPTRAEAALESLYQVGPRTVVWLNEAQHYLGDREFGGRIAAAVHRLLLDEQRGPVLVLGTLWPEYARAYTALPTPGEDDRCSQVRELLAGHIVGVPDNFDAAALAAATALAERGDALLADALTRSRDSGRITQDLAGAPELLLRYEQPRQPAARALLEAAMDARRLGVGLHLPQAFLTAAAPDYLSDDDYDQLTIDWVEQAYAELAEPVHGKQAPLRRTTPRPARHPPTSATGAGTTAQQPAGGVLRLADYLEQHGRCTRRGQCPPATFWHAAHTHLTHPDDLNSLAQAAQGRHRLQWSHHLRQRAADHGNTHAMHRLALMREKAGDHDGARDFYRQAANLGDTHALVCLAVMREAAGDRDGAKDLARQAADHGNTHALVRLALMREAAGDRDGAKDLARQAADHGNTHTLVYLAEMRKVAGDRESAEDLARQAADHGNTHALVRLAVMREEAGDHDGAKDFYRQCADHGDTYALRRLAVMREAAGDHDGAKDFHRQAADHGDIYALRRLALMREAAGDRDGAEDLARQAADHGNTHALVYLAVMREEAGDHDGAEDLARQAIDHGTTNALRRLAEMREEAGDRESAEDLARQAADLGDTHALCRLALVRRAAGDRESAEDLARQAADLGNRDALFRLAEMREEAGGRESAEDVIRQAADLGNRDALFRLALVREEAGDRESAEDLIRQAADLGNRDALFRLALVREEAGDRDGAGDLARQAADLGNRDALFRLALVREEAGDRDGAGDLARQAADLGNRDALFRLALMREAAGDRDGAEDLARQAANYGGDGFVIPPSDALKELWLYGLDPDGTPTSPWQPTLSVERR